MTASILELLLVAIAVPAGAGAVSGLVETARVLKSRRSSGQSWSEPDTFHIKDAALGATTFFSSMGAALALVGGGVDWPAWQWWGVIALTIIASSLLMLAHARWSAARGAELFAKSGDGWTHGAGDA